MHFSSLSNILFMRYCAYARMKINLVVFLLWKPIRKLLGSSFTTIASHLLSFEVESYSTWEHVEQFNTYH
jgi:hypothetical protein